LVVVSKQSTFEIKLSNLTYMLLYPCLIAVGGWARNIVYYACGVAGRLFAAVGAFPIDFIFVGVVAWPLTKVGITYIPKKFSFQIAKGLFL
jgi:hypothetical protein